MEGLAPNENYHDLQPDHNGADRHEQPVSEDPLEDVQRIIVLSATAKASLGSCSNTTKPETSKEILRTCTY